MKPMIQPGTHPDAEVLNAFAEQLLSDIERKDVIAHMADCGRCREVVFLAQKAMEAEEPVRAVAQVSEPKTGGGWFSGWKWSWIPVAALAGVVGFAVIRHMNRASESETRMAQALAPPEVVQSGPTTKAPVPSQAERPSSKPSREEAKQKLSGLERSDRDAVMDRKSLDERDAFVAQKKDEAGKESDSLSAAALKDSERSIHGTLGARAKTSGVGGPMAQNQVQQQNSAQLQQNYANEERQANVLADSANKPVSSPTRSGSSSETVTVQASGGPMPVSPAPSAAPTVSMAQLESAVVSQGNFEKRKAGSPVSPSKLAVLSEAASAKRMIAIDTAGSVFLSEDAGKHWEAVNTPWRGRAVLVKKGAPAVEAVGGLLKQSIERFELTTDKQETWISSDGKNWTLKAEAGK
jgi:hypothetical protein